MPNLLALAIVALWPIIAWRISKKVSLTSAAILLFLVPYLLLPMRVEFDFPLIPPLNKTTIPALIAFIIFYFKDKGFKFLPREELSRRLVILTFIFPVFTVLANGDRLVYGPTVLQGLTLMDIVNMTFSVSTSFYIPLIVGINYLRTEESHRLILKYFVVAALVYALPVLWEIRMSPQLHTQLYGFFPHNFGQQVRQGGFRAVVFLGHGLLVSMMLAVAVISAASFKAEQGQTTFKKITVILLFLLALLVLNKSVGPLMYGLVAVVLILFLKLKTRFNIALGLAALVFVFPVLRGNGFVPVNEMTNFVKGYSEERAQSIEFRFHHEDLLLEKANKRKLFGWGSWGRNRIYDPYTGQDLSVTDGYWIIIFGNFGWLGYLAVFGLLFYPLVAYYREVRSSKDKSYSVPTVSICIILALTMVDTIPNASISQLTFLLAGALIGRAEHLKRKRLTPIHDT